jgi:pimeloyl-ACP methyl ester carboxylesterase
MIVDGPDLRAAAITFPDSALADLRRRLRDTRWPCQPSAARWRYGTDIEYLGKLVERWRDRFDWRAWERRLSAFTSRIATVRDDSGRPYQIHCLIARADNPDAMPLLLTHGWPGSVLEFLDVIDRLATPERFGGRPAEAFHVVAPSLPGYGLSPPPADPIDPAAIAGLWHDLMTRVLRCGRYGAHGGDWGAVVSSWLGVRFPEPLVGLHLTMAGVTHDRNTGAPLSEQETAWLEAARARMHQEGAYQAIQGTKPSSLGVALSDSPAGLAAWIIEKFHGWSDSPPDGPPPQDPDWLLANLTYYWLTNSIGTANWLYRAVRDSGGIRLGPGERVAVPTAFCFPARDLVQRPPDSLLRRSYDVARIRDLGHGGHFLAVDAPEALVDDIRRFFRDERPTRAA